MAPHYLDFFLTLNGVPGKYTVEARGPGEISVPPVPVSLDPSEEVQVQFERIKTGAAPSRESMKAIGEALFEALIPRPVARAYGRAFNDLPDGSGLRFKLSIRPPELSVLPWEMLYDVDEGFFLAARLSSPVVRYVESSLPTASLQSTLPLRILYVQSAPKDQPPLNLEASEKALRQAAGEQVEISILREASISSLRDWLRQPFHILHFDGHAGFDPSSGEGFLFLQDSQGYSQVVGGEILAAYLDSTSVRLGLLMACETGTESGRSRFAGLAQHLMRSSGLAAVVAMQFAIPDTSAIAFIRGFYGAMSAGFPVDAAVVEGRKAILEVLGGDAFAAPDWATPVLFMRPGQGDLMESRLTASVSDRSTQDTAIKRTKISTGNITSSSGGVVNIAGGDIHTGKVEDERSSDSD